MRRATFAKLGLLVFALVFASFLVLGFGRILLPYRTARLLAAPTLVLSALLAVGLLLRATLALLGISRCDL